MIVCVIASKYLRRISSAASYGTRIVPGPWPNGTRIWAMMPSCVKAMFSLLGRNHRPDGWYRRHRTERRTIATENNKRQCSRGRDDHILEFLASSSFSDKETKACDSV